jgi:hypothetical protein
MWPYQPLHPSNCRVGKVSEVYPNHTLASDQPTNRPTNQPLTAHLLDLVDVDLDHAGAEHELLLRVLGQERLGRCHGRERLARRPVEGAVVAELLPLEAPLAPLLLPLVLLEDGPERQHGVVALLPLLRVHRAPLLQAVPVRLEGQRRALRLLELLAAGLAETETET